MQTRKIQVHVDELCCPSEFLPIEKGVHALDERAQLIADYSTRTIDICVTEDSPVEADVVVAVIEKAGFHGQVVRVHDAPVDEVATIYVPAMDCPVEVREIEAELQKRAPIQATFDVFKRQIRIPNDANAISVTLEAITAAGYQGELMTAGDATEAPVAPPEPTTPWGRFAVGLVLALLAEAIELSHEYNVLTWWGSSAEILSFVLALLAIAAVGLGTFKMGMNALRRGKLNMNTLMSVAVVGAILIGAWPEAAMVLVLFEISEALEARAMNKARRSIRDLMSVAPEMASVIGPKGDVSIQKVEAVLPGHYVRVAPGDRIPLDGKILKGESTLDESMVTGEGMPKEKTTGDTVWAGTVNLTGSLDILVTARSRDSLTARIIEAVENAQASKSSTQRFVDRFAEIYTPFVFVVAILVAIVGSLVTHDVSGWLYKALCLLVIACPCALVVSTPVTIVSALSSATRSGLLIKGGLYLEQARLIRNIGLDKTGTLTKGEPKVAQFHTFGMAQDEALRLAASLGQMNKHPLSQAICQAASAAGLSLKAVEGFTALPGSGVQGRIGSSTLALLNRQNVVTRGFMTPQLQAIYDEANRLGQSTVALVDLFGVLAVWTLSDDIKPEAKASIQALEAMGITPWLLTGDNERAAQALAHQLGLTHIKSELLPEDKLATIGELQATGVTAMVGDGINDAPALAQADIGIAMGIRGTDSAIEAADIAIMDDRLHSLVSLIHISRRTHTVLLQNIAFAIGVKVAFSILALTGHAAMWMAVFADTGTCLLVVANAMRMLNYTPPK